MRVEDSGLRFEDAGFDFLKILFSVFRFLYECVALCCTNELRIKN